LQLVAPVSGEILETNRRSEDTSLINSDPWKGWILVIEASNLDEDLEISCKVALASFLKPK
jgi:glycine cleavage system H lipoate-binding protein